MKKWKLLLLAGVLCLTFGCQNNTQTPDNNVENVSLPVEKETDEEVTNRLAAEKNPALRHGNVLYVGASDMQGVWNPVFALSQNDRDVNDLIFNGLVKQDRNGRIVPDLADYVVSDNGLTYTFTLKENVYFHNGEPVTADDVAFTYYIIAQKDYDGPYDITDVNGVETYHDGQAANIRGIDVKDSRTISFTFKEKNVKEIYDFLIGILPRSVYDYATIEELKQKHQQPVGSGPMKFKEADLGAYLSLERNEEYFEGAPALEGVYFKEIPLALMPSALNIGEVDFARIGSNPDSVQTLKESGIAKDIYYVGDAYRYIGINHRIEKLQDKRVRQALWYGLDLRSFVDAQWQGFARNILGPVSPESWAYPGVEALNTYAFNPEKAKELLSQAGWTDTDGDGYLDKNGEKFTLEWTTFNDAQWPQNLIDLATENWGDLGIELTANIIEFESVMDLVYEKQDFEIYNMAWNLDIDPDPIDVFGEDADVLGGYNAIGFEHRRANQIFEEALNTTDFDERQALYQEWVQIANEEVPYIFISIAAQATGLNQRVSNFEYSSLSGLKAEVLKTTLEYVE